MRTKYNTKVKMKDATKKIIAAVILARLNRFEACFDTIFLVNSIFSLKLVPFPFSFATLHFSVLQFPFELDLL